VGRVGGAPVSKDAVWVEHAAGGFVYTETDPFGAGGGRNGASAPPSRRPTSAPATSPTRSTAPEHIKAKTYPAFDIQVLYRAPIKQATIWATVTPTTPGIIAALTTDPRTDNDTAYGNQQIPI
jgi:hypothetical protein